MKNKTVTNPDGKVIETKEHEDGRKSVTIHVKSLDIDDTDPESLEAKAMIEADNYLTVWNQFRSNTFDPESESTANASESGWLSSSSLTGRASPELAAAALDTPINTASDIIVQPIDAETSQYFIIMVSGREVRSLSEQEYQGVQQQNLQNFISQQQVESVEFTGFDVGRTPTQPVLDPLFTQQPTPNPLAPPVDAGGGGADPGG